jgi:hypothetical protein
MSKSCGSCVYYTKWKKDSLVQSNGGKGGELASGLCEFLDARTKPDWGHSCPHWVGKRYDRSTSKKQTLSEINEND